MKKITIDGYEINELDLYSRYNVYLQFTRNLDFIKKNLESKFYDIITTHISENNIEIFVPTKLNIYHYTRDYPVIISGIFESKDVICYTESTKEQPNLWFETGDIAINATPEFKFARRSFEEIYSNLLDNLKNEYRHFIFDKINKDGFQEKVDKHCEENNLLFTVDGCGIP